MIAPRRSYDVRLSDSQFYVDEVECLRGCPVGTNACGYIVAISRGAYAEGYRIARGPNPFASICGQVCGAPCEVTCRRGKVDKPLTIRAMKGFLTALCGAETVDPERTLASADVQGSLDAPASGKRVALVGAGVASLTCAHDLARLGHECHVFEREDTPGGLLVYGVPLYRLDRDLVRREVEAITSMRHVRVHLGKDVGRDVAFADLRRDYDAVFLGAGLPLGKRIPLPGSDHPDVRDAMAIIHDYCAGHGPDLRGRHVIIIGGGNVAMDISRSSLRLGAQTVRTVCLERSWEEAPADWDELRDADEEGVKILPGWGPMEVVAEGGAVKGLRCRKVLSVFDDQGRFAPTFDDGQVRMVEGDMVIFSVGQASEPAFLEAIEGVEHNRGILRIDAQTKQTSLPGVFAGGDIASGPGLFINCIQDGSLAALAIDAYLTGRPLKRKLRIPRHQALPIYQRLTNYLNLRRKPPRLTAPSERARSSEIAEHPFSVEEATFQADRCLECHINPTFDGNLCIQCSGCVDVCPEHCLWLVDAAAVVGEDARAAIAAEFGGRMPAPGEGSVMLFDKTTCIRCGLCAARCPTGAVTMERATFQIEYQDTGRIVQWSTD